MATRRQHRLSNKEVDLLRGHIGAYCALYDGLRLPKTPAQEHFVKVAHGEILAETDIEKAFLSFLKLNLVQQAKFIDNFRKNLQPKIHISAKKKIPKISAKKKIPKISIKKTISKKGTKKRKISKAEEQRYIEKMHRISGYNTITARFVRG